jgi:hypothetical protein
MGLVRLTCLALLAAALPVAGPAAAQSPDKELVQGVQAYRELEMESASWLLRQALSDERLKPDDRKTALSYLGAAEFYRDRRDSALAAFGQLVRLDPDFRLDRLVFPPDAQEAFEEARRRNPSVRVTAHSASFAPNGAGLPVRLDANTPQVVVMTFESVSGDVIDTAFHARVTDTATVFWKARGDAATPAPVGGFVLGVSSLDGRGRVARRVELPVHVTRTPENPLAIPEPPPVLPVRQPAGPAFVRLGLGIAAATVAYLGTPLFTDQSAPRVLSTGLFAAAGVIGFWDVRPGKPLPANVVANEVARAAWRARVANVEEENGRRAVGGTVHVEVGGVRVAEGR